MKNKKKALIIVGIILLLLIVAYFIPVRKGTKIYNNYHGNNINDRSDNNPLLLLKPAVEPTFKTVYYNIYGIEIKETPYQGE